MITAHLTLLIVSAGSLAAAPEIVPWAEARAAIGAMICVKEFEIPGGGKAYVPIPGSREACGAAPATDPLGRAVDEAFSRAVDEAFSRSEPVLRSIEPAGLQAIHAEGLSIEERTRLARESWLASEDFLRLFLPHLASALRDEGLECAECPSFPPRPARRSSWQEFLPYLTAHFWPDPVRTLEAKAGEGEKRQYGMHICARINGVSEMKDPDPLLVRAGFLGAFNSHEGMSLASHHFHRILGEKAFASIESDDARTSYLRRRLPEEIAKDRRVKDAVCATLRELETDLALRIEDCDETAISGMNAAW